MSHDDAFLYFQNYETMDDIAKRVARRHGLTDYREIMVGEKYKAKRRPNYIVDARGEFIYEAYRTGRYSLKHIGKFLRMRYGKGRYEYKQSDLKYVETHVNRQLTRWCKRHNVERPKWGTTSKPYWRAFDDPRKPD